MKKIFIAGSALVLASLVGLTACKKKTDGDFPTQASSNGNYSDFSYITPSIPAILDADGILVAAQVHNYPGSANYSPIEQTFEYGMAEFTNTPGNFSALADADSVRVNGTNLNKGSNLFYLSATSTYSLNFANAVSWFVKGSSVSYTDNATMPQDSFFVDGAGKYWDDAITPLTPKDTILHPLTTADSLSNIAARAYNFKVQYSIPIRDYIKNADTVFIVFSDATTGYNYTRKVLATDSVTSFKPQDFWGYSLSTTENKTLQINAIKYTPQTFGGKKYYVLKMASYIRYWKNKL